MSIGKVCSREVAVAESETTIEEAAKLMRRLHVGDLVMVGNLSEKRKPSGILTDRDIVLSVVALGLDPAVITVGDIISKDVIVTTEQTGVFECIQHMRSEGIRRMPVVDNEGVLIGIVSVDDLIQLLAEEMAELGKLIAREQAREKVARR